MTIEFTVPGVPQGKERPRFTQNGETYTPKKTKDYEKLVAWAYQCEAHGAKFTGTIRVDIAAIYPVPHSWSKRKQAEAIDNRILPMVKPDWDNIGKIVCDALNGIAYKDDAAITDATVCKRYGTRPCVAVRLTGEEAPRDTV
ncbi:RusA family crossover junction endodeoxyribonuclease [Neglectibacter timonensis]|uniref:RusA family crossover junction endodeoxyribonuclease n=1 Tax=Neglectibacter timonensis TaxID=1776382 RepID=UPI00205747F9|nr:RusA family crossover junction endodeoxyribonuclease [Neglectibacter timonensis]DAR28436.1 MAG TPA: Endodeoxyribonuclease RusA [Caudoviricetes sp.]